eukprot:197008_1
MSTEKQLDNFHLSGNSPQQSNLCKSKNKKKMKNETVNLDNNNIECEYESIEKRERPETPKHLSKNQAKKWRKNWIFEEKKRLKNLKQEEKCKTKIGGNNKQNVNIILPQYDNPHTKKKINKAALVQRIPINKDKEISIFKHLAQTEKYLIYISPKISTLIHPVILRAGLYYNDGSVWGANTRCIIMLNAFLKFIKTFKCSSNKIFTRELLISLNQSIQFLNDCRPQSVSMGNTIRWLKNRITKIAEYKEINETINTTNDTIKNKIIKSIREYVYKIETADKMICVELIDRICNNDVLLTYSRSYVIEKSIIRAYNERKKFSLIIIDSRPHYEGKNLLLTLSTHCPNLQIIYTLINSISYIMSTIPISKSKVILGAASIMSNGSLVSRNGTSIIALTAKYYKIPVIVCCETYKFSERVQIDSICSNELGDFDALIRDGYNNNNNNNYNNNNNN